MPLQNRDNEQNLLAFPGILPYNGCIASAAGTGGSMADETHDGQNIQANDGSTAVGNITVQGPVGSLNIGGPGAAARKALPSLHQLPQLGNLIEHRQGREGRPTVGPGLRQVRVVGHAMKETTRV